MASYGLARLHQASHKKNYCRIVDNRHASHRRCSLRTTTKEYQLSVCLSFYSRTWLTKTEFTFVRFFDFNFVELVGFLSCLSCIVRPRCMWLMSVCTRVLVRFPDLLFSRYFADVKSTRPIPLHVLHYCAEYRKSRHAILLFKWHANKIAAFIGRKRERMLRAGSYVVVKPGIKRHQCSRRQRHITDFGTVLLPRTCSHSERFSIQLLHMGSRETDDASV